jgi:general secretion pathway protein G
VETSRRKLKIAVRVLILAIVAILVVWLARPKCGAHGILRAKESVLRQNLDTLRKTIDAYTYDKRSAPYSLHELVSAGYLRKIPPDPITGHADWRMYGDDVHSSSKETSCEGTLYNTW